MSVARRLTVLRQLIQAGLCEIEVGSPAVRAEDHAFLRTVVDRDLLPDQVTISVTTPADEEPLRQTLDALTGVHRAVIHLRGGTVPLPAARILDLVDRPGLSLQCSPGVLAEGFLEARSPFVLGLSTAGERALPHVLAGRVLAAGHHAGVCASVRPDDVGPAVCHGQHRGTASDQCLPETGRDPAQRGGAVPAGGGPIPNQIGLISWPVQPGEGEPACDGGGMRDRGRRYRIIRYRADPALTRGQAAARISAYVYGNILVFAATVPLTTGDLHHGHAALLVLGTAVSTFVAHVFADVVGHNVRSEEPMSRADLLHELRDALPIVTSGLVPVLLFVAGGAGWIPERAAVLGAEGWLLFRMALIGLLIERLRSRRASLRTLIAGFALAGAAAGVSLLKVALGH